MKSQLFYLFLWLAIPLQAQWELQNSGTTEILTDIHCISADTVIIVGTNATILRTTDGGAHWVAINSPVNNDLLKVKFANSQTGYIVGGNGTLLKSNDFGLTWQNINSGTTESLSALEVKNADTLYIAGSNNLFKKSTDGGQTWHIITTNLNEGIFDMQFFNNIGYAFIYLGNFQNNKLYKTVDGGHTWQLLFDDISSMKFADANYGVCGSTQMRITTDGFNSYSYGNYNVNNLITAIAITDNHIWTSGQNDLACSAPNFYSITDRNTDITSYADSNNFIATVMDFYDETTGYYISFWDNKIVKYKDGSANIENFDYVNFDIYPNPASQFITIETNKNQKLAYTITDTRGRIIQPQQNLNQNKINISNLTAGVYYIQLFDSDKTYTQKLIIQK